MEDRLTTLFFEVFSGLPRQGPGDPRSTLRALSLIPGVGPRTRVLDIGCGTGAQTLVLAQHAPAHVLAVDIHPPFVDALRRKTAALGLSDRLETRVADMRRLDFPEESFDVIWCEGAIFVIGMEAGLREWRRFLEPGGHIALTEACWTAPPPPECAAFWAQEYPSIRDRAALLAAIVQCGYEIVGHFTLPSSSWWDDYYRPLQHNVTGFRERHTGEPDAQELADRIQNEIDIWHTYSEYYSYEFCVIEKC